MTDTLLDNYKDYSALIHDLNITIAKHVNINNEIKCLVMVSNCSESLAFFNTKESDAKKYLTKLASSFDPSTRTLSDYYSA